MSKTLALALILVFLTASCIIVVLPVSGTSVPPNSWVSKAPMHIARSDLGLTTANGKIYAIGGNTENGYIPNNEGNDYKAKGWITNINEEYNPITDTWAFKTPMPTQRYEFAIANYQGKIYCLGGITNWVSGDITYTTVNEVYDPSKDSWQTKASLPIAISGEANIVDDKIYVMGKGSNATFNEVYDPATDTWAVKTPMSDAPSSHPPNTLSTLCSTVIDNKIHVLSYSGSSALHMLYNPVDDTWSTLSSSAPNILQEGNWWSQTAVSTTGVNSTKQVYVFFARYPQATYLPNFEYNSLIDKWMNATSVPTYRQNFGVVALNDIVYAVGGRTYNYPYPDDAYFTVSEQSTNEQYIPFGYGTPDPATTPTPSITPPTPTSTVPELQTWTIPLILTIMVAIAGLLVYSKKRNRGLKHE